MSEAQTRRHKLLEELLVTLPAEQKARANRVMDEDKLLTTRARVLLLIERVEAFDPEMALALISLITNTHDPEAHPALRRSTDPRISAQP